MFTPTSATTGPAAAGSAWCRTTRRAVTPLPWAVRTKSSWSVERSCEAHMRVQAAASGAPTITAGSQSPCRKPTGFASGSR